MAPFFLCTINTDLVGPASTNDFEKKNIFFSFYTMMLSLDLDLSIYTSTEQDTIGNTQTLNTEIES